MTKKYTKLFATIQAWSTILILCFGLTVHAGTLETSPPPNDAGTVGVGATKEIAINIQVTNSGETDLTLLDVISSHFDFHITQPRAGQMVVVPPMQTYLIVIGFSPSAQGARAADITITSDSNINPTFTTPVTGYGGIEQSIILSPNDFEIELGQGIESRAMVIFDNGATGIANVNWSSSNENSVTVTAGDFDSRFDTPTSQLSSINTGQAVITVSGTNNPLATASTTVTVVDPSAFQFTGAIAPDKLVTVRDGQVNLCYDFPETDITGAPLFEISQVAGTARDGKGYYVAATDIRSGISTLFAITRDCLSRNTHYTGLSTIITDLELTSGGNPFVVSDGQVIRFSPDPIIIVPPLLPSDPISEIGIDSENNIYFGGLMETFNGDGTLAEQHPAVYVQPFLLPDTWFPIAAVFDTLPGLGAAAVLPGILKGNYGETYVLKQVSPDLTSIDRYIDLNGDFNHFNIIGTTVVPDPQELLNVVEATPLGVDLHFDYYGQLIATASESNGQRVMRFTDKNGDRDYNDANEMRVLFQSTASVQLSDVYFSEQCVPRGIDWTLPLPPIPPGPVEYGEPVFLSVSVDPCGGPYTYHWDTANGVIESNGGSSAIITFTGSVPAVQLVQVTVTNYVGLRNTINIKVPVGPPHVDGFWPSAGAPGTVVFLFGKNFVTATGGFPTVDFNTTTSFLTQVLSDDLMLTVVPSEVRVPTSIPLHVNTNVASGTSVTNWGEVTSNISINGIWPAKASAGTIVFVFGSQFDPTLGGTQVTINGVPNFLTQVQDETLLLTIVPPGTTTGPVCVTAFGTTACSALDLEIVP